MNRGELIGAAVLAALGLTVAWEAVDLKVGTMLHPGPGFFALGLGMALATLSLVTAGQALLRRGDAAFALDGAGLRRIAGVVGALLAYLATLPWLGFIAGTTALMWILYGLAAERLVSWKPLAGGGATTLTAWVLFERLLDVNLPAGSLWGG